MCSPHPSPAWRQSADAAYVCENPNPRGLSLNPPNNPLTVGAAFLLLWTEASEKMYPTFIWCIGSRLGKRQLGFWPLMLRRHKNSNTRRLGNVEQKNIFFGCSKTQMLADIERWSEWGSMFPHFPKYQSGMLIDYFACSWVVFQVWCSCLVLKRVSPIIRRDSSPCWLADEETIATPHFTFRGCPSGPTNCRSWEVTQKQIITFIPPLQKK